MVCQKNQWIKDKAIEMINMNTRKKRDFLKKWIDPQDLWDSNSRSDIHIIKVSKEETGHWAEKHLKKQWLKFGERHTLPDSKNWVKPK